MKILVLIMLFIYSCECQIHIKSTPIDSNHKIEGKENEKTDF